MSGLAEVRDPIDAAAEDVLCMFGESTGDLIDEAASATWPDGEDDWIDNYDEKHADRTFALVVRALVPKLIAAAEAAETRANA